jgi:hypothetical protein
MPSKLEDDDEAEVRSGSAELRRLAEQEYRLADQSELPMVRQKHLLAAQRWAQMAADRERLEQNSARRLALEAEQPIN